MNHQIQERTLKIIEPARIASLLKRMMKEQVPITVSNNASDKEWYGTISEMLFHQGELIISEIENVGSEGIKLDEGQNQFHGKLTGVAVNFESAIINIEKTSKKTICRVTYPTTVSYHQRRSAERVGFWVDQKVPVNSSLEGDAILKGHMRDISIDGMNACFYRIISIAPNEVLPTCSIQLPSGKTINSKLEVKGLTVNENSGQLHVRGRFLDMKPDDREELSKFVQSLERTLGEPR